MNYTKEIIVNKPIDFVVKEFDNPDNLTEWIDGIVSMELISGTRGEVGAKTNMKFDLNNRKMEMVETILEKNLPDVMSFQYDAKGVKNIVNQRFEKVSDDKTKISTETTFNFKGFMKIIALLMPGAFKKQTMKYLENFKKFVENKD